MNCDACVDLSGVLRSGHFNWSVCGLSEGEGWIDAIEDSFISRVVMILMLSDWMSAILLAMFVSIYNLAMSILVPTLLLTPVFSRSSSNNVVGEEIYFSCSMSFEENLVAISLSTLVLSERGSVTDLRLTSSSICLSNRFSDRSFCSSNFCLERSSMAWIEVSRIALVTTGEGVLGILATLLDLGGPAQD